MFSNPNTFGGYLAPMVGISFVTFVWGANSKKKRLLFILPALILNSWAILLSFSRGAMVQVLLSMVVIGYIYYAKICQRQLSWKVLLIAGLIGLLLISAVQLYDLFLRTRLSSYREQDLYAAVNWIQTTSDLQRKNAALKAH